MESDEEDFFNPNMASSNLKNLFDNLDQTPDDYNSQLIFVPPKQPRPNNKSKQIQSKEKEKIEPKLIKKEDINIRAKLEYEKRKDVKPEKVKSEESVVLENKVVYITAGELICHEVFEKSSWYPIPTPEVALVICDGLERKIEVYESIKSISFTFVIDKDTKFTGTNSTMKYYIRSKTQVMEIRFQSRSSYLQLGSIFLRLNIPVGNSANNKDLFPEIPPDWTESKDMLMSFEYPTFSYNQQDILNAIEMLGIKKEIRHEAVKNQMDFNSGKHENSVQERDNLVEHSEILSRLDKLSKEVTDSVAEILSAIKQNEQIHSIEKSIECTLTQSMKNGDKLEEMSNNMMRLKVSEQFEQGNKNDSSNEIKRAYVKKLENIMKTCETQFAVFKKDVKASMDQLNENLQVTLQNHGCHLSESLQEAIGDDIKICTYEILGKSKEWAKIMLKNDPHELVI